MIGYLRAVDPSALELVNVDNLSRAALKRLLGIASSYDMLVADLDDAMRGSSIQRTSSVLWLEAAASADHILAPSPQAYAFAQQLVGESRLRLVTEPPTSQRFKQRNKRSSCLGIIPARGGRDEFNLISAIARYFRLHRPEFTLFILGATVDDLAIMQIGNSYVAGVVPPEDLPHVSQSYDVDAHFLSTTRPLFGHPATEFALTASVPVAYLDWSRGRLEPDRYDLALDPANSFDQHAHRLSEWLQPL